MSLLERITSIPPSFLELLVEVENRFDIQISGEDQFRIRTVGDLYDSICERLKPRPVASCLSTATFLRLRHSLMWTFGVPRDRVQLSTPLAELLPQTARRQAWRQLEQHLQLSLDELCRPRWLSVLLMGMCIFVMLMLIGLLIVQIVVPMGGGDRTVYDCCRPRVLYSERSADDSVHD